LRPGQAGRSGDEPWRHRQICRWAAGGPGCGQIHRALCLSSRRAAAPVHGHRPHERTGIRGTGRRRAAPALRTHAGTLEPQSGAASGAGPGAGIGQGAGHLAGLSGRLCLRIPAQLDEHSPDSGRQTPAGRQPSRTLDPGRYLWSMSMDGLRPHGNAEGSSLGPVPGWSSDVPLKRLKQDDLNTDEALPWDLLDAEGRVIVHRGEVLEAGPRLDRLIERGLYRLNDPLEDRDTAYVGLPDMLLAPGDILQLQTTGSG